MGGWSWVGGVLSGSVIGRWCSFVCDRWSPRDEHTNPLARRPVTIHLGYASEHLVQSPPPQLRPTSRPSGHQKAVVDFGYLRCVRGWPRPPSRSERSNNFIHAFPQALGVTLASRPRVVCWSSTTRSASRPPTNDEKETVPRGPEAETRNGFCLSCGLRARDCILLIF